MWQVFANILDLHDDGVPEADPSACLAITLTLFGTTDFSA
jgi:hypothetical protein